MSTPRKAVKAAEPPSALVVKGLDADDIAALDAELEARRASLPAGAVLSRNALVVALIREALASLKVRASGS